jgi:hypothetical protein
VALIFVVAAELLTTNKLSELACLALYLMYEKKQGKESYWYPYIRELDRQRGRGQLAVESPLLWSQEEVDEYFAGSPMRVNYALLCTLLSFFFFFFFFFSGCWTLWLIGETVIIWPTYTCKVAPAEAELVVLYFTG